MINSTNNFFTSNTPEQLSIKRNELLWFLKHNKRFNLSYIEGVMIAYDYFCINRTKFDGATIVTDLYDFYNIEISALVHDYIYLEFNVASHLPSKRRADRLYGNMLFDFNNDKETIRIAKTRVLGLWFSSYHFWLYNRIKNGKMTNQQKIDFNNYIKKFE
jgi:hypothetical protein